MLGMDTTVGEGDASFDVEGCTDGSTRRLGDGDGRALQSAIVTIETEVTVALETVHARGHTSALELITSQLDATTLGANILDHAARLGGRRRRLGMSSVSVESLSVATFSPTPAPTSTPTTSAPTAAPSPSRTVQPTKTHMTGPTQRPTKYGNPSTASMKLGLIFAVLGVGLSICVAAAVYALVSLRAFES